MSFERSFIKRLIFNNNIFNSVFVILHFIQFIILYYLVIITFLKNLNFLNNKKNNRFSYNLIKRSKKIKFNIKNCIKMYSYWLQKKKSSLKRIYKSNFIKKRKKKIYIHPFKLRLWARQIKQSQSKNTFFIKIKLKKHNVFLTLINRKGTTLLKTNLGSSGFKKRKKFTGFAIEQTSLQFFSKSVDILQKILKTSGKKILFLTIKTKNMYKHWSYRFVKKGFRKSYFPLRKLKTKIKIKHIFNISHSKGLRLKKPRRV